MQKFGLILSHLGSNQLAYSVIRQFNKIASETPYISPFIFYEDANRPCVLPRFATIHVNEIWGFDGPVVATTLNAGLKLKKSPGPTKKILYLWDLEWINFGNVAYEFLYQSLLGFDKIIARSTSHKAAIENVFHVHVDHVIEDADAGSLLSALNYDN